MRTRRGLPFVSKAGQLLNNMINNYGAEAGAGLHREYCEVEASGESHSRAGGGEYLLTRFLLRQIDVVRPEVIVALGSTAATIFWA